MPHHIIYFKFFVHYNCLGCKTHFCVKKISPLHRRLVSSGLIYLPGEQRHSWQHWSNVERTACSQTYRTTLKRDIKRRWRLNLSFMSWLALAKNMLKQCILIRNANIKLFNQQTHTKPMSSYFNNEKRWKKAKLSWQKQNTEKKTINRKSAECKCKAAQVNTVMNARGLIWCRSEKLRYKMPLSCF